MKCEYGCNQEAKYQLDNKKWCCSKSRNSCPELRRKNSEQLKNAHKEGKIPTEHLSKYRNWAKGLTKQTSTALRQTGAAQSIRLKKLGNDNPFIKARKERPRDHPSYKKQSETVKRLYAQGLLSPPKGAGRGKYSYLIFKNKKYLLRSTYEFVFALYLLYKKIDFRYENIRVQYNNSTKISDFEINGKVYEVKGFKGQHVNEVIEAFEKNGYCIRIIYYNIIFEMIKFFRRRKVEIDVYLDLIVKGHNSKQYFRFDVENFKSLCQGSSVG